MKHETIFSEDRVYRYTLWRDFECDDIFQPPRFFNSFVQFIGLNPSTADENNDDPTIRRCIQFAKDWGYGSFCMTNLFAFRATDPRVMKLHKWPIGADNTNQIMDVAGEAGLIVAAWGRDGSHMGRGEQVLSALASIGKSVYHLGLNGDGTPKHPLYLRGDTMPSPFDFQKVVSPAALVAGDVRVAGDETFAAA